MFGSSGNDGLQISVFKIFEFFILLTPFLVEFQKFKRIQHFQRWILVLTLLCLPFIFILAKFSISTVTFGVVESEV